MEMESVGLLEVYGFVMAFAAADAACKAANVSIDSFDRNKPASAELLPIPLVILVKIRGSVSDVNAAMAAGEAAAARYGGVLSKHVIPRPDIGMKGIFVQ
jgi:microcompartment protein CcmL/EutN